MAALQAFFRVPATLVLGYTYIYRLTLKISWSEYEHLLKRAFRVLKFGVVGLTVLVIGQALLYYLTHVVHVPDRQAYLVEAAVSVELNFLGSWFYTWRERRSGTTFIRAFWQFNTARIVSVALNSFVFLNLWLVVFDQSVLVANLLNVVIASAWNYSAGENIIFAEGNRIRPDFPLPSKEQVPRVSVVIPCKGNADTIRRTVQAIHDQTYTQFVPDKVKIILVGDPNEPTWESIEDWATEFSFLNLIEVLVVRDPEFHRRDANGKRSVGAIYAWQEEGSVIVFADADILPPRGWMWRGVSSMIYGGYDVVAGPLAAEGGTFSFWDHFIDRTTGISGSKTLRVPREYELTPENIGEHKPPVTANMFVRQRVTEAVGEPPPNFTWSYEDYAYVQRIIDAGFRCLIDPWLGTRRVHRQGFDKLSGEYLRSGNGCGDFITAFRHSRFTVWRLVVMAALPLALAGTAGAALVIPVSTLAAVTAVTISLMLTNLLATLPVKRLDGLVYPFIGVYFSLRFVHGVCQRFARLGLKAPPMPKIEPAKHVWFGPDGRRNEVPL